MQPTADKLYSNNIEFDKQHGHYFSVACVPNSIMNQYTSTILSKETDVTIWTKITDDITQAYEFDDVLDMVFSVNANSDRSLALDYNNTYQNV